MIENQPCSKGHQETVPRTTPILVLVDVQKGFTDDNGSLARQYGIDELSRIRSALCAIARLMAARPPQYELIMVRSEYRLGEFTEGNLCCPLAKLCVLNENSDCEWSVSPALKDNCHCATKNDRSVMSSPAFATILTRLLPRDNGMIVVGGFTFNNCVRASALDIKRVHPSVNVEVCLEIAASRVSKYARRSALSRVDEAANELRASGIIVTDTLRPIQHTGGGSSCTAEE